MIAKQTNPARRLHDILAAVISVNYSHGTVESAWATACGAGSPPDIARSWLEVVDLLDSWETLIKQNTTLDIARYLGLIETIRTGIYRVGLSGQITELRAHITNELLTNLSFAADATGSNENVLDEHLVQTLLSETSEIIEDIVDSDFEADLKTVLIAGYESARFALLHYTQFGTNGLWEAFYKNLGIRMAHHGDISETNLGNRIDSMLVRVFDILQWSSVRHALQLGSNVTRLLGSGTGVEGESGY